MTSLRHHQGKHRWDLHWLTEGLAMGKDRGKFLREVGRACTRDRGAWMTREHNDTSDRARWPLVQRAQTAAHKYYAQRTGAGGAAQEGRGQR
eukprot:5866393-Pyramimonas_sp.AAC.1